MGCQVYRRNGDSALVSADDISPSALENCLHKAAALCPESPHPRKTTAEKLFSAPAVRDRKILPVSHGSYPILLDAHLTGGLVHEAFGHAAEGDSVCRGSINPQA